MKNGSLILGHIVQKLKPPSWANLIIFGVAATCEEVNEEEDEGEYEPGGGHTADDAQALQVQLGLWSKSANTLF